MSLSVFWFCALSRDVLMILAWLLMRDRRSCSDMAVCHRQDLVASFQRLVKFASALADTVRIAKSVLCAITKPASCHFVSSTAFLCSEIASSTFVTRMMLPFSSYSVMVAGLMPNLCLNNFLQTINLYFECFVILQSQTGQMPSFIFASVFSSTN